MTTAAEAKTRRMIDLVVMELSQERGDVVDAEAKAWAPWHRGTVTDAQMARSLAAIYKRLLARVLRDNYGFDPPATFWTRAGRESFAEQVSQARLQGTPMPKRKAAKRPAPKRASRAPKRAAKTPRRKPAKRPARQAPRPQGALAPPLNSRRARHVPAACSPRTPPRPEARPSRASS
jgi:hypothetical protein